MSTRSDPYINSLKNEIEQLQARATELDAIVDTLPKCNRLNEAGELVCDKPVVLEMPVWLAEMPARFQVTKIELCGVVEIGINLNAANYRRATAGDLYDSCEAAEAARGIT